MKKRNLFLIPTMFGIFLASCGGDEPPAPGEQSYTITFKDEIGNLLESKKWDAGTVPHYNYVKEDTAEWDYTVQGWSTSLNGSVITIPAASADATYYAVVSKVKQQYTVTFANTTMPDKKYDYGYSLAKPTDPTKTNYLFVGWYNDAGFGEETVFPIEIKSNVTIYAKWYSYSEAFAEARKNTIGDDVAGYEYDYSLAVSAGYMGLSLSGNTTGNTKYNASTSDVSFYDEHVNSGALFYDGSKYQIKKGRELHEISLDENETVKKYNITQVGDDYKYDSSSFAKAVFDYDDSKLKSISKTSTPNEYKLETSFNFSSGLALVGNYVNHPMVEYLIGQLPETSVNTGMYVAFSGDKLSSYRYEMNIDVSGIQFSLVYRLSFKNIGVAPTITPKVFNNTYVADNDVSMIKNEINTYLNSFKSLEHSSYDFVVKTAVDYANKNAINATVDGWTKRKVEGNEVYYLNDYEVDTDHKNADLYKSQGLKDCHAGRVKLSTGEVHDIKNKLIGSGYSDVKVVDHDNADNFYLFDVLEMVDNLTFVQKITKENKVTYSIGADTKSAVGILNEFNNLLRLNPLGECSVDVKAFGQFDNNSVTVKNFEFKIIIVDGVLSEIALEMNGKADVSFPNSRDFTSAQVAGYKLSYSLSVTDKGSSYEPAESVDKVK